MSSGRAPDPIPDEAWIRAKIVLPLAVIETLIWAVSFYMFPAMLPTWEQELGWGKAELSGAFSVALILAALGAPVAGRLIDRHHGRATMIFCCCLTCVSLVLLSRVQQLWQFYLVWAALGVAMSGSLYEACFAFVTRLLGAGARSGITLITLFAGFAGTISFPGTHMLNELLGWRGTLVVFAGIVLLLIVPLLLRVPTRFDSRGRSPSTEVGRRNEFKPGEALKAPVFWLLASGFSLLALEHGMIITHLLPLLHEKGLAPQLAVLAASVIGPMQVFGRLTMIAVQRRISISSISIISVVSMAIAALALNLSSILVWLILFFVLLHGAGWGVTSIARPVITAEYLGLSNFGAISGLIGLQLMLMSAVAPLVAATLWQFGGYNLVILAAFLVCLVAIVCLLLASARAHKLLTD